MVVFAGEQTFPTLASLLHFKPRRLLLLYTNEDHWPAIAQRIERFASDKLGIVVKKEIIGRRPEDTSEVIVTHITSAINHDWIINSSTGTRLMFLGAIQASLQLLSQHKLPVNIILREMDKGWQLVTQAKGLHLAPHPEAKTIDKAIEDCLTGRGSPSLRLKMEDFINVQRPLNPEDPLEASKKPANLPNPVEFLETFTSEEGNGLAVINRLKLNDDIGSPRSGDALELFIASVINQYGLPWEWGMKGSRFGEGEEQDVIVCVGSKIVIFDCKLEKQDKKERKKRNLRDEGPLKQILAVQEQKSRWGGSAAVGVMIRPNMLFEQTLSDLIKNMRLERISEDGFRSLVPEIERILFGKNKDGSKVERPVVVEEAHQMLQGGHRQFFSTDKFKRRAEITGILSFGDAFHVARNASAWAQFEDFSIIRTGLDTLGPEILEQLEEASRLSTTPFEGVRSFLIESEQTASELVQLIDRKVGKMGQSQSFDSYVTIQAGNWVHVEFDGIHLIKVGKDLANKAIKQELDKTARITKSTGSGSLTCVISDLEAAWALHGYLVTELGSPRQP